MLSVPLAVHVLPLCLLVYSYLVYPMAMWAVARVSRVPSIREQRVHGGQTLPDERSSLPPVAVVVSAFNEQEHIAARIENVLTQDYPQDLLRVYVGSDGSTDATPHIIQRFQTPRVVACCRSSNGGKASMLNFLMQRVSEPITVFTDANTMFRPDAVRVLVAALARQNVGCVSGELRLVDGGGSNAEGVLWGVERQLKRGEALLGASLGANGAIYAIRTHLYQALPPDTIVDDFCISMNIASAGWDLEYAADAIAVEQAPDDMREEFLRRIRIGIGNYQALFRHPEYFYRGGIPRNFAYVSHKVLRWSGPHLIALSLIAGLFVLRDPDYAWMPISIYGLMALLWLLYLLRDTLKLPALLRLPVMLLVLNLSFCAAFWRYIRGDYRGSWQTSARR